MENSRFKSINHDPNCLPPEIYQKLLAEHGKLVDFTDLLPHAVGKSTDGKLRRRSIKSLDAGDGRGAREWGRGTGQR
jgi:hypothetical protein